MLILFDSSVWIEFLVEDSEHKEKIREIYNQAGSKIIVSKINIYEVYAKLGQTKGWQAANNAIEKIMANSFIIELELAIIKEAVHLRNEKGLSTADSIIAATAIKYNAMLVTCDNDFNVLMKNKFHQEIVSEGHGILKDKIKLKFIY